MKTKSKVRALCECAIMIALSAILSLIKLVDLPAGGSVTAASMLPIVVLAYRHGVLWGVGSGLAASLIQMLLGLSSFSYVTGWQSVLAVLLLDFILAFTVFGLSGIFRKMRGSDSTKMLLGAILASVLRYILHVIAGATVWAGLSIPSEAALLYSLSYNATFMVPETVILALAVSYVASVIDFTADIPTRVKKEETGTVPSLLGALSGLSILGGLIYDVVAVFGELQAKGGEFDITGLASVHWLSVIIVSAACSIVAFVLMLISVRLSKKEK